MIDIGWILLAEWCTCYAVRCNGTSCVCSHVHTSGEDYAMEYVEMHILSTTDTTCGIGDADTRHVDTRKTRYYTSHYS